MPASLADEIGYTEPAGQSIISDTETLLGRGHATVFEGFMIVSGSISGNLVMYEMEGQPAYKLFAYAAAAPRALVRRPDAH